MNTTNVRKTMLAIGLAAAGAAQALAANPNDGDLDPTWDDDGKRFIFFDEGGAGNNQDFGTGAVVGPDGSMYVSGRVLDANGSGRIGIAKVDPLGEMDFFFSTDGKNLAPVTGIEGPVKVVFAPGQPDRVLLAGTRRVSPTDTDMIVCAFHADFGVNLAFDAPNSPISGCTTATLQIGLQAAADILLQPDGKFVVVGTHASAAVPNEKFVYAARFNANGSIDNSFQAMPRRNTALFDSHDVSAAALASNGKIVIVGASTSAFASGLGGLVMRLSADGTPDPVNVGGEVAFGLDAGVDEDTVFHDVVLENDPTTGEDAIVAVGTAEVAANQFSGLIARIVGSNPVDLDDDFGNGGFSTLTLSGNFVYTGVALHPCAGYVTIGNAPIFDSQDIRVNAWSRAGTLNTGFGFTGIDIFPTDQADFGREVVVFGDGIYVAGTTQTNLGDLDFAAAKLFMDSIFCSNYED